MIWIKENHAVHAMLKARTRLILINASSATRCNFVQKFCKKKASSTQRALFLSAIFEWVNGDVFYNVTIVDREPDIVE